MSTLATTFAALGDATRFAIVERLLQSGELPAGDLHDAGSISAPAISRHLKVLREAGIVDQRIDKQRRIYSVRPEAMQELSQWLTTHQEFWNASLNRLESALVAESKSYE